MRNQRPVRIIFLIFSLFTIYSSIFTAVYASEKWPGVDESIVEKFAREHGREAKEPLINTGQGDLLLFVFLLAGIVGGFTAGYYWRILTAEKPPQAKREGKKATG
jgi:hypothetical protein